jgi:hypothetical protein
MCYQSSLKYFIPVEHAEQHQTWPSIRLFDDPDPSGCCWSLQWRTWRTSSIPVNPHREAPAGCGIGRVDPSFFFGSAAFRRRRLHARPLLSTLCRRDLLSHRHAKWERRRGGSRVIRGGPGCPFYRPPPCGRRGSVVSRAGTTSIKVAQPVPAWDVNPLITRCQHCQWRRLNGQPRHPSLTDTTSPAG